MRPSRIKMEHHVFATLAPANDLAGLAFSDAYEAEM